MRASVNECAEVGPQGKLADIIACTKCSKGCFGNLGAGKPAECVLWPAGELDAHREQRTGGANVGPVHEAEGAACNTGARNTA
jgi:hypothetical protein